MKFHILGDLKVEGAGGPLSLTSHRQRAAVVMLVLAANREVAVERLAQAIWDESPPPTARDQIQICVSMLRKRFGQEGVAASIVTGPVGYALEVDPAEVDLLVFEDLVAAARRALDAGHPEQAERDFHAAVGMWPATGNPPGGSQVLDAVAVRMAEQRLTAIEEWAAVRLDVGEPDGLVPVLLDLVALHPLRERLRGLLMRALHRTGRRAEALDTYRAGREVLVDELGIEPGEELRQLQQHIIADEPKPRRPVHRVRLSASRSGPARDPVTGRPVRLSGEDKALLVLGLLSGDLTVAEAARKYQQPEADIELWQRQFLDGGRAGLTDTAPPGPSRDPDLSARVAELTTALGEAHIELRTWKRRALTENNPLKVAT
ncbi:AfsR/SARP family transcriptional regulator [Amycolatopsis sp. NPDC024027]|uniref:AfsR/SARP family transcriptional regulator n=1 Tax=Amycolatopsis sp. NPDC024027 TaxID=3154327 RepID=UPI0033F04569